MPIKGLRWKASPAPTGPYRSFYKRGWPVLEDETGKMFARIDCEDSYNPGRVRAGTHAPLILYIADRRVTPFEWRRFRTNAETLQQAKSIIESYIKMHPELFGTEE